MHVYVANYFTIADFEAELDDPSVRDSSLWDMASPQLCCVGHDREETIERVKRAMLDEIWEVEYEKLTMPRPCWEVDKGWTSPEFGRPYTSVDLLLNAELVGVVVVQKMEVT